MTTRICVVGLVQNHKGDYLICKKPDNLGVYPGLWGIPGGAIETGESMQQAFIREMREEIGVEVEQIEPLWFSDDHTVKHFADGTREQQYLIYLYFRCRIKTHQLKLNQEFEDYAWVNTRNVHQYQLGDYTRGTLTKLGLIQ